jgi:NADH-quinone oxidoreductase subunit N
MRVFLLTFAVLFIVLARLTGIADREDGQDFYVLALGATLGMSIMASANHLLTIFLGVEMASVPSYVLAGIVKGRRRSSEAALKYAVYGAGTAGVMLYGISLLAGMLGTAHLPTMAAQLVELNIPEMLVSSEESRLVVMVLALGGLMMGVGLAFKLSAVPFHFWCPDVFEGASAEVDAFLSVASKAAALALLVRVGMGLSQYNERTPDTLAADHAPAIVATATAPADAKTSALTVQNNTEQGEVRPDESPLAPVRRFFVILTAIVAVVTCTFGNLAAYGQTNIKRMLAYSTIAHAGFMMMPVAAAVALLGRGEMKSQEALSALMLYIFFYLFMNLGAFAIVAFLRNSMHSEEIADYAGLIRSCPLVTVVLTAILVSLIGLPPLAGFWPKLRVLQALYEAGGPLMMFTLVAAALNTAISLVYYLRVAKVMCIDEESDTRGPVSIGFLPGAYALVVGLPVIVLGVLPDRFAQWANVAVSQLFG